MPLTELKKWSTTAFKPKSASDLAQIPTSAAVLDVFKRGATVNVGGTVTASGGTLAITVYDIGSLAVNATVQVGKEASQNLTVTVITSATSITVRNDGATSIILANLDRLVITSSRPTLYKDVTGASPHPVVGQVTMNSSGFVEFYTNERYFDYIISGGGFVTTLFVDEESGPARARRTAYNVKDFLDTATALAAIPAGARLYFPAEEGPYIAPSSSGWTISKAVEIFSDYGVAENVGFKYFNSSANQNDQIFTIAGGINNIYLHDIVISNNVGTPPAGGTGDAIRFSSGTISTTVFLDRVRILYAGRSAVRFTGANFLVKFGMKDCFVFGCRGDGAYLNKTTHMNLIGSTFTVNKGAGVRIIDGEAGIHIASCDISNNGDDLTLPDSEGQLIIENCHGASVMGCNFEDIDATTVKNGIVVNAGDSVVIGGNQFHPTVASAGTRGIQLYNNARNCTILANAHSLVDVAVNVNTTGETGHVIFPQHAQNAGVNGECAVVVPADTKGIIFVNDQTEGTGQNNNKTVGIAFPGLAGVGTGEVGTTVLRAGLLVFDTTANKFKFYNGAAWETITSV